MNGTFQQKFEWQNELEFQRNLSGKCEEVDSRIKMNGKLNGIHKTKLHIFF